MEIDKSRIQTQEETHEKAPMDKANDRVEAEMKLIESEAKEQVAQGLQDPKLAREAEELRQEAENDLKELADAENTGG